MQQEGKLQFTLEMTFWLVTALVTAGVLYPIYRVAPDYPFWTYNIAFILVFITATRYAFLVKHTWLAFRIPPKLLLMVLCIPGTFLLIEGINYFQTWLDENTFDSFLGHLSLERQETMTRYIRSQMIFFGTAAIIGTVTLFLRMLLSIWRNKNRGTA